jgi:hypothetical protein
MRMHGTVDILFGGLTPTTSVASLGCLLGSGTASDWPSPPGGVLRGACGLYYYLRPCSPSHPCVWPNA